jgi:hypothetical protein
VSKYKISIASNRWHAAIQITIGGLLGSSVWLWQPVMPHQWLLQLAICVTVVGYFFSTSKASSQGAEQTVLLSEEGRWQSLLPESDDMGEVLTAKSRFTSWMLWLHLQATCGEQRWLWVYRYQLSEDSFRRMCRIIYRQQKIASVKA